MKRAGLAAAFSIVIALLLCFVYRSESYSCQLGVQVDDATANQLRGGGCIDYTTTVCTGNVCPNITVHVGDASGEGNICELIGNDECGGTSNCGQYFHGHNGCD